MVAAASSSADSSAPSSFPCSFPTITMVAAAAAASSSADSSAPSTNTSPSSNVPPPFLTKTYDMVDDPATDDIVSWSDSLNSFVVWNIAEFARDLLPQYFKHSNFSSFVRQLNTYGFHKIDPDRWEFANEEFTKGNRESLKNIHRRKPSAPAHPNAPHSPKDPPHCNDPKHAELEEEINRLRQDKSVMVAELAKLRQQQKMTEMELQTIGGRLQDMDKKHQQMIAFMARVMQSPGTWMQAVQLQNPKEGMRLEFSKKRRLLMELGEEAVVGIGDSGCICEDEEVGQMVVEYRMRARREENCDGDDQSSFEQMVMQLARSTLNHHSPPPDHHDMSTTCSPISRTSGITLWGDSPRSHLSHAHHISRDDATALSSPNNENNSTPLPGKHDKLASCISSTTTVTTAASSSTNDIFWENLLTENPKVADKGEERWFL